MKKPAPKKSVAKKGTPKKPAPKIVIEPTTPPDVMGTAKAAIESVNADTSVPPHETIARLTELKDIINEMILAIGETEQGV